MGRPTFVIILTLALACASSQVTVGDASVSARVLGDGHAEACLPGQGTGRVGQQQNDSSQAAASEAGPGCAVAKGGRFSLRAQAIWAALVGAIAGLW